MDLNLLKQKLQSSLDYLGSELAKIRTGRANSLLVEGVEIEAYGSKMKIKELGSVSVPDSQTIVITPWDKSLMSSIDKALRDSTLGLNPVTGSDSIKVPVPALTEERRKELVKVVGSRVEEAKNALRNVRQDAMKDIDKSFSEKLIGEDEKFTQREKVEEIVKDYTSKAEEMGNIKKDDILQV